MNSVGQVEHVPVPAVVPPVVRPDWTLSRLKESCPGVELALFSHFGIGSRERSGFSGKESLEDLLRRHLVFDADRACRRLTELAQEDWKYAWTAPTLRQERENVVILDCRGREDFEFCALDGSHYLSADFVKSLLPRRSEIRLVLVCNDGSHSPSASRVLRKQGFAAFHLWGGLYAWSVQVDRSHPVLYPLVEEPGGWYLLADGRTLRYRWKSPSLESGFRMIDQESLLDLAPARKLLELDPSVEAVFATPRSLAFRARFQNLCSFIGKLSHDLLHASLWATGGVEGDEEQEAVLIERVLSEEAPSLLENHKGTVVARSYEDRVLTLALGGGCAGCASAQVTTQRELAGLLYRRVPLIDRIVGES